MKKHWPERKGETPLDDVSGLKLRIPDPTRAQVNLAEALNIQNAAGKYLRGKLADAKAPFNLPWMMKLHQEMFGDVWSWAGKFRDTNTSIGADKINIQMLMLQLAADLKGWPEMGIPVLEQAARLHHRAVQIHPFKNGNGRWARMLANIWLRKHDAGVIAWPDTAGEVSPIRDEYIAALKEADNMNEKPLLSLHERYWQKPARNAAHEPRRE
jgi:Fic-DOC domain mobile mystery protein B